MLFQELWRINDDSLPIALHHGSLDVSQRRRVEKAMADGQPARRRRHLDARSRHRLGRRRSRHPCRRAEGREPAGAAHRPRQPPHGRAVARRSWCRPTASRCSNAAPRSRRAPSARRTRRRCVEARSTCCRSTCSASPAARRSMRLTSSTTRCAAPHPMRCSTGETFERVVDFVATGGYALQELRALRAHPPDARTASGASAIRASRSNTG